MAKLPGAIFLIPCLHARIPSKGEYRKRVRGKPTERKIAQGSPQGIYRSETTNQEKPKGGMRGRVLSFED